MGLRYVLIFLLIFGLYSLNASGGTLRAELSEFTEDGEPIVNIAPGVKILIMMKRGERALSFEFIEKGVKTVFKVINRRRDGCGSMRFYAVDLTNRRSKNKGVLVVYDHTLRICEDLRPAIWEVKLFSRPNPTRYFQGNPVSLFPPRDCSKIAHDAICLALYAPATCTVDHLENGIQLKPPIEALGTNSCYAALNVRVAACERGFDPERIDDEDIYCTLENIPTPACPLAACPESLSGCETVPSDEVNENGCPLYPCGIPNCPEE